MYSVIVYLPSFGYINGIHVFAIAPWSVKPGEEFSAIRFLGKKVHADK